MATLSSIVITPFTSSIALGKTEQFTATGYYSDGSIHDITSTAAWTSGTTSVATIASTGIATSVALGATVITATSGGKSSSVLLTILNAHHTHTTSPIIMNTPLGHLKFRQSFTYNTPQIAAGPDPCTGHMTSVGGNTVMIPPKPRDQLQDIIEVRADIPAPTYDLGQEGVLAKDPAYPIQQVVESPTSSDSTSGIWVRGKVFAGNVPNW
jgi:hypothetical protein